MIRSVTVTNHLGASLKMELARPDRSGFVVESIQGLGPEKADVNVTEVSTDDGGILNSSRVPCKNIVLNLSFLWRNTVEEMRQLSYRYFPLKKKIKLLFETDNRLVEIEGIVESNDPDIFSDREGTEISILCEKPFFYSAGDQGLQVAEFYSIIPMFEFPFGNESLDEPLLIMGEIQHLAEKTITYEGDTEVGITITIHAVGEAKGITIYNTGTREIMSIDTEKIKALTGSGIVAGNDIIISTVRGSKSIRLLRQGVYTNILNCLDKNASWFMLSNGENTFAYTAEEGIWNLRMTIENRILYWGI